MQRHVNHSGYFLVVILIFIHIFTIVTLYELSQLKDEMKFAKVAWQSGRDNVLSEYVLSMTEKVLANKKNTCIISRLPSIEIRHRSNGWWEKVGCEIVTQNVSYRYVIERLTYDPCGTVSVNGKTVVGLAYYRINVKRNHSQSVVQAITAVHDDSKICIGSPHLRVLGRQSWREF